VEEKHQPLHYGRKQSGIPSSTAALWIKMVVAVVGAVLLFWFALWRLFGNSDF